MSHHSHHAVHPTHHALQIRSESYTSQTQIRVPHIRPLRTPPTLLDLFLPMCRAGLRRPQIRRDRYLAYPRHVKRRAVHPYRTREIASESVDEDLVLVEFEDDIGEPPQLLALERVAIPAVGLSLNPRG